MPARIIGGRIHVPLRFVGESLGLIVEYQAGEGIYLKSAKRCGLLRM